jgi:hypothetical protein
MDKSKAKKAKSKAEHVKAVAEAMQAQHIGGTPVNPEVQAAAISLQPQAVNPYHMMGSMPPNVYSPGNLVGGYTLPQVYNPEA